MLKEDKAFSALWTAPTYRVSNTTSERDQPDPTDILTKCYFRRVCARLDIRKSEQMRTRNEVEVRVQSLNH